MEKYLNSKGRNIIGWDEIMEGGLAPNAIVMSWRGVEGLIAANAGHDAIMTGSILLSGSISGKPGNSSDYYRRL